MKVYVVLCSMEGCDECGYTSHVVGVYTTKEKAEMAENIHFTEANPKQPHKSKLKGHFHYCNVCTEEATLEEK